MGRATIAEPMSGAPPGPDGDRADKAWKGKLVRPERGAVTAFCETSTAGRAESGIGGGKGGMGKGGRYLGVVGWREERDERN